MSTATKAETITWHVLPDAGMPDSQITVLVEFIHTDEPEHGDTWPAWWDGDHWIDASTGDQMERGGRNKVLAWCDMPAGSAQLPADPLLACDIAPRPLAYPLTDYHRAGVDGPLHYTWQDKPHRLLYDLIAAVRFYAVAESRHSPTGVVERKSETVSNNAQPPADPTALCLRLQAEADMWRANGDENLYVLLEEAVAAISQPPAPSVPTSRLLDRAEALHLNAGMPWHQARELALSEIGVDGSAIVELVGECAALGTESLLTGDEICDFTRAVLVHGSALMVTLTSSDQADMRSLLRCAEKVRDWMGDGCNPDETPKPQLAALAEWAGSTASAMLSAAPPPVRERLTDERIREIGETLGAKIPGVSDHASWGCGYRADNTGSHTIPCLPANLVPFARAIERALIGGEG